MTVVKTIFSLALLFLAGCGGGGGTPAEEGGNPGSSTGTVPDSGQTSCYYDIYNNGIPVKNACLVGGWDPQGQDGNHSINAMSFTDNGDGTILDNVTGLVWKKCSLGESGTDCSAGSITSHTWSTAKSQCANLNFAGTGWRLPTVVELTQIVNYGKSYSAIDNVAFPGTGSTYWSSTAHAVQAWAWYVNFTQGNTQAMNQTSAYYVRCVRG